MIGSIISAAIQAGGAIAGGISAAKSAAQMRRNINQQMRDNQNWYDRRYNEDSTQRADAQRLLTMTEESIRNRNRQAAATAAVMGGTDESVAAARAANNEALSDTMSRIAAEGDARKDAIEQQYMQNKIELNNSLNELEMQKQQAIQQAIGGVSSAAGDIAGLWGKQNKENTNEEE